jgi:hypothetical protein
MDIYENDDFFILISIFNIINHLWFSIHKVTVIIVLCTGADPGFVLPEAYTIFGALFKEKNTKLQIQN